MENYFQLKYFAREIGGVILSLYLRSRISQGVDAQRPTDPLIALNLSARKYTKTFTLARFADFATSKSSAQRYQALQVFSFEERLGIAHSAIPRFEFRDARSQRRQSLSIKRESSNGN